MQRRPSATPSLLLFGPQAGRPSSELLETARDELQSRPCLSELRHAISNISTLWQSLVDSDSGLARVPGHSFLRSLELWVIGKGPVPETPPEVTNMGDTLFTFILHIVQYVRFLTSIREQDAHQRVLEGLKSGGVQGLCVGFLSAVAIVTSEEQDQIGFNASQCFELAVCIAAHVDRDRQRAVSSERTACFSICLKDHDMLKRESMESLLRTYPDVSWPPFLLETSR